MDKFSDIFDQLDIYDIVLMMIQRVGSIERTGVSASEFVAERERLNKNLALFDIQKTMFENKFSVKAGYTTSIDNLILSCIMELPVEKQGKFLERLSLSCEQFEYCSPEEWTDFLNVLSRSSESRERYDDDMNFARFVVQRTNYLRKQIPAIVAQFSTGEPVVTVIADKKPEAADIFEYDVEYVNKIYDYCQENLFQHIAHNEFCQCIASADFAPIFERVVANKSKSKLLYVIHKLHSKVKEKKWYAQSAASIGCKTKDCTKYKDDISDKWISEIDRIK